MKKIILVFLEMLPFTYIIMAVSSIVLAGLTILRQKKMGEINKKQYQTHIVELVFCVICMVYFGWVLFG